MVSIGERTFAHILELKQYVRNLIGKYGHDVDVSESADIDFFKRLVALSPSFAGAQLETVQQMTVFRNRKTKATELRIRFADNSEKYFSYMDVLQRLDTANA